MSFEGPLPPPQLLAQYEAAIPGLGERIITLMEKQTDHRITLEKHVIGSDISRSKWGLAAGFVVAMAGLGISYYLIATGNGVAGAILSGVDIVSLAGTFIYGTASRRAERLDKQRRLLGQD
jgi:uncharacterized membrane protein